jgi:HK97 family phage prohead protease
MDTKRLVRPFELKELDDDGTFTGYGSVFGVKDQGSDIVAKGAFQRSLRTHKKSGTLPAMLWQHRGDSPIGVYTSMKEDDHGLLLEGKLATKTSQGADAYELMKMKAVSGLSIGYSTVLSEYDDKKRVRTLKDVDLWEVSLVTFPMNPDARIAAVKGADDIKTIREFEDFLRDVGGFSAEAAKRIASGGFKAKPDPRDEAGEDKAALIEALRKLSNPNLTF